MRKHDFIVQLRERLSRLPYAEIKERVSFYGEMIDERMEDGFSEEEAVAAVGDLDTIVAQIFADRSAETKKKKKRRTCVMVLLILGSPVWLSLLIAAIAVGLSLYALLWSVIVSIWAVEFSLFSVFLGGVVSGVLFAVSGHALTGMAILGAALLCAGLSVFAFYGCKAATKGAWWLTVKIAVWFKNALSKKEKTV